MNIRTNTRLRVVSVLCAAFILGNITQYMYETYSTNSQIQLLNMSVFPSRFTTSFILFQEGLHNNNRNTIKEGFIFLNSAETALSASSSLYDNAGLTQTGNVQSCIFYLDYDLQGSETYQARKIYTFLLPIKKYLVNHWDVASIKQLFSHLTDRYLSSFKV